MSLRLQVIRDRLYAQISPDARPSGISPLNRVVLLAIILGSVVAVLARDRTVRLGPSTALVCIRGRRLHIRVSHRISDTPLGCRPGCPVSRHRRAYTIHAHADCPSRPGCDTSVVLRLGRLRCLPTAPIPPHSNIAACSAWAVLACLGNPCERSAFAAIRACIERRRCGDSAPRICNSSLRCRRRRSARGVWKHSPRHVVEHHHAHHNWLRRRLSRYCNRSNPWRHHRASWHRHHRNADWNTRRRVQQCVSASRSGPIKWRP
jgi:hypothetical protein